MKLFDREFSEEDRERAIQMLRGPIRDYLLLLAEAGEFDNCLNPENRFQLNPDAWQRWES